MSARLRIRLSRPALAALLALLTLSATIAHAATAGGGLSIAPAIIEPDHPATPGFVGSLAIANTTTTDQKVTVTPRPWIASPTGVVTPDPHQDLKALILINKPSLTIAAGTSKSVTITLRKPPPGGSLFGSIVVEGIPVDAGKRSGITVGYRLISRLRLDPATPKFKVSVGAPRISGKSIVLPMRNTGNTLEPIGGNAQVVGATGTRNIAFTQTRILPGTTTLVGVAPASEFRPGRYTIRYNVTQTGTPVASGKKTIQLN
jgi:hypothetical protein